MVEDRRILSTSAQRKKPTKQTWTTTWKRSVTFLPQAPASLSCLHQNGELCSQCQGLSLRLFLGRGRTGLALPLGLPERVPRRPGCLAEVWVCATWRRARPGRFNVPKPEQGAVAGPVPGERAYTLEHRSEPASDSGTALAGAGWQPYYSATRRPAQGARSLSPPSCFREGGDTRACSLARRKRGPQACTMRLRSPASPTPPLSFAPPCYPLYCR